MGSLFLITAFATAVINLYIKVPYLDLLPSIVFLIFFRRHVFTNAVVAKNVAFLLGK